MIKSIDKVLAIFQRFFLSLYLCFVFGRMLLSGLLLCGGVGQQETQTRAAGEIKSRALGNTSTTAGKQKPSSNKKKEADQQTQTKSGKENKALHQEK